MPDVCSFLSLSNYSACTSIFYQSILGHTSCVEEWMQLLLKIFLLTSHTTLCIAVATAHWPRNVRKQYCRRWVSNSRRRGEEKEGKNLVAIALPSELFQLLLLRSQFIRIFNVNVLCIDDSRFLARGQRKTCSTA